MNKVQLKKFIKMASENVAEGVKHVQERLQAACEKRPETLQHIKPRLVAVSKTKPIEFIIAAYKAGQRHFGENYFQELLDKATDVKILHDCPDIKWHYIGLVQSKKVPKLINIPGLFIIETVHSEKLANTLENALNKQDADRKLKVFIQINTSGEKEKNGVPPYESVKLTEHILNKCPHLSFDGIMTVGQFGYDLSLGPNPDFQTLLKCKTEICEKLNLPLDNVEVSMGMSDDFEHAISVGSTNVRVGSLIFGYRPKTGKLSYLNELHDSPVLSQ